MSARSPDSPIDSIDASGIHRRLISTRIGFVVVVVPPPPLHEEALCPVKLSSCEELGTEEYGAPFR